MSLVALKKVFLSMNKHKEPVVASLHNAAVTGHSSYYENEFCCVMILLHRASFWSNRTSPRIFTALLFYVIGVQVLPYKNFSLRKAYFRKPSSRVLYNYWRVLKEVTLAYYLF